MVSGRYSVRHLANIYPAVSDKFFNAIEITQKL
jgi:hypothetical protein